jgi:sigma-B regulation protein RsbU (phosphoserine phosphatase)
VPLGLVQVLQKAAGVVSAKLESVQSLVENVRAVMGSDTASLLLLNDAGSILEPSASAGLGRRWRGATHVPVGSGFAGRVAAGGEPVVLNEVNEVSVLNPVLRDFGVTRLLGVPVLGPKGLLGVLHVGSLTAGTFTLEDARRLTSAAAEIGERLSETAEDHAHLAAQAALTLQRSLLPSVPPLIDGLDLAVRYLPAEGDLGGDWYDIFTLPSGKVAFVMGDVEGHGLRPAVAMGRLRSALRAYALDYEDPAELLYRLDRKICYFENEFTATVVLAISEPPFDLVTICRAGHPAPLMSHRGQAFADIVDSASGPLLGIDPDLYRHSDEVSFPPGAALAFYTDGLIERRKAAEQLTDPDVENLDKVRRAFVSTDSADTACSRIIAAGLGDDIVEDDVALMVLRRPESFEEATKPVWTNSPSPTEVVYA